MWTEMRLVVGRPVERFSQPPSIFANVYWILFPCQAQCSALAEIISEIIQQPLRWYSDSPQHYLNGDRNFERLNNLPEITQLPAYTGTWTQLSLIRFQTLGQHGLLWTYVWVETVGWTVEEKCTEHSGGKAIEPEEWMDVGNEGEGDSSGQDDSGVWRIKRIWKRCCLFDPRFSWRRCSWTWLCSPTHELPLLILFINWSATDLRSPPTDKKPVDQDERPAWGLQGLLTRLVMNQLI